MKKKEAVNYGGGKWSQGHNMSGYNWQLKPSLLRLVKGETRSWEKEILPAAACLCLTQSSRQGSEAPDLSPLARLGSYGSAEGTGGTVSLGPHPPR